MYKDKIVEEDKEIIRDFVSKLEKLQEECGVTLFSIDDIVIVELGKSLGKTILVLHDPPLPILLKGGVIPKLKNKTTGVLRFCKD